MSYLFTGVFTDDDLDIASIQDKKFVARTIATKPKLQYGIYFPELLSQEPEEKSLRVLKYCEELKQYGLEKALYLNYFYYRGILEQVDSFIIQSNEIVTGSEFSLVDQPERKMTEKFVSTMRAFGIDVDTSGYFQPFEKGFWGEDNQY